MRDPGLQGADRRRLNPDDGASRRAQRRGHPVDRGNDLARHRHLGRKTLADKIILHVDHDERGARGVELVHRDHAVAPAEHALFDGI